MLIITIERWKGSHKVRTIPAFKCDLEHTTLFPNHQIILSVWVGSVAEEIVLDGGEEITVTTESGVNLWRAIIHKELLDYRVL